MQILADGLATEGRIRAHNLNPGAVRSGMRSRLYSAGDPEKLLRPDDIMPAYPYVPGSDSRRVSGQALNARDFLPEATDP